jgi:hypothetical protein
MLDSPMPLREGPCRGVAPRASLRAVVSPAVSPSAGAGPPCVSSVFAGAARRDGHGRTYEGRSAPRAAPARSRFRDGRRRPSRGQRRVPRRAPPCRPGLPAGRAGDHTPGRMLTRGRTDTADAEVEHALASYGTFRSVIYAGPLNRRSLAPGPGAPGQRRSGGRVRDTHPAPRFLVEGKGFLRMSATTLGR